MAPLRTMRSLWHPNDTGVLSLYHPLRCLDGSAKYIKYSLSYCCHPSSSITPPRETTLGEEYKKIRGCEGMESKTRSIPYIEKFDTKVHRKDRKDCEGMESKTRSIMSRSSTLRYIEKFENTYQVFKIDMTSTYLYVVSQLSIRCSTQLTGCSRFLTFDGLEKS